MEVYERRKHVYTSGAIKPGGINTREGRDEARP
jgi:hypothetical protein